MDHSGDAAPRHRYSVGDEVEKASGYVYPGTVVSVFTTLDGNLRYVVEHRLSRGMLHIFNEGQLTFAQEP